MEYRIEKVINQEKMWLAIYQRKGLITVITVIIVIVDIVDIINIIVTIDITGIILNEWVNIFLNHMNFLVEI